MKKTLLVLALTTPLAGCVVADDPRYNSYPYNGPAVSVYETNHYNRNVHYREYDPHRNEHHDNDHHDRDHDHDGDHDHDHH